MRTGIEGDSGHWQVMAIASDDAAAVPMFSLFPQKCPAHKRAPGAELLIRINFGIMMGCFEMDYDSGRIHFKTALPFARGDRRVYGGCLCSCNGRGRHLFGRPSHNAGLVQQKVGPIELAGFFCNGEIGPVGDRNFLHGYTASLALLLERPTAES